MTELNRKKLFVQGDIQKGIIVRFLMYIAFAFFFITLPVSFGRAWLDPTQLWVTHFFSVWVENWPLLLCLALFIPFAIIDLLRFSHRIVGPIFRLKNEIKKLGTGDTSSAGLQFRENDFWDELSGSFNQLAEQIQDLKAKNEELTAQLAEK